MRYIRSRVLPRFELFSLHYDDIPGQRNFLLTAHPSVRSMSYMPNVSMLRSHKAAGLANFLVTVSLSAMGSAFTRGLILRPFSHTSYLPPDWFEWPRWNTPHCSLNATKSSSPQFPLVNRYRPLNRGSEAESELFTQGGDFKGLFVTSLHACSSVARHLTSWHLISGLLHHRQSRCATYSI
jgi:hypothetical protein